MAKPTVAYPHPRHPNFVDITGQVFGWLTVIEYVPPKGRKGTYWSCRCRCGTLTETESLSLRRDQARSCGCSKTLTAGDIALREQQGKACSRCKSTKSIADFGANKSTADGRNAYCKPCARQVSGERYHDTRTPWKRYIYRLRVRYGLTLEQYRGMLKSQTGRCAICKKKFVERKDTHVDHCHRTGKVRGLLCSNCNRALGYAKDDPRLLRAMARFLEKAQA